MLDAMKATTHGIASYDLERVQHERARAVSRQSREREREMHRLSIVNEELASSARAKFFASTDERRAREVETFVADRANRPNTPFTDRVKKELMRRTLAVAGGMHGEDGQPSHDHHHSTSSAPAAHQHEAHQHFAPASARQLREQPAQASAARLAAAARTQHDIETRVAALESRMRKTRVLEGLPPTEEGFARTAASTLRASAAAAEALVVGSGGGSLSLGGGRAGAGAGAGGRGAGGGDVLEDYVVILDGNGGCSSSTAGASEGGAGFTARSSGGSSRLPPGWAGGGSSLWSAPGGGAGDDSASTSSRPGTGRSAARGSDGVGHSHHHHHHPGGFDGDGLDGSDPHAPAAAAAHSARRSASPGHCGSPRPDAWPRPWRSPSAQGKFQFQHQAKQGVAYAGTGDYSEWSHSFRDRDVERELGSPRISTTLRADPRRAFGRPGELDVATTAVIEAEKRARHWAEHPFLWKHGRVFPPADPYTSGGVDDHDIQPVEGDKEKRAASIGVKPYLSLPRRGTDILAVDAGARWSAWSTPVVPVPEAKPGRPGTGGVTARLPPMSPMGGASSGGAATTLRRTLPGPAVAEAAAAAASTLGRKTISKGTQQQEEHVARLRAFRGPGIAEVLPAGYGAAPRVVAGCSSSFTVNVREFARTGVDPLAVATTARDPALTATLGLSRAAVAMSEHLYADPVHTFEFHQSPFRDGHALGKRLAEAEGQEIKRGPLPSPAQVLEGYWAGGQALQQSQPHRPADAGNAEGRGGGGGGADGGRRTTASPHRHRTPVGSLASALVQGDRDEAIASALHPGGSSSPYGTRFVQHAQQAGGWSFKPVSGPPEEKGRR
jgi:hypothetical protein